MCGIAGVMAGLDAPPPSPEELKAMVAALAHRGPDGWGMYRDGRVGLGHARLSLVDLGGSFQPLSNEDGSVWLSFNGEIFNYRELREELKRLGRRFHTEGDGEVIINAYDQWGEGAWARLNGQFAFALWDWRAGLLFLVRDRMGILPLFVARAGAAVVFASEVKALFAGGRISPRFDGAGLAEAFVRWSAAAPRSVFAGVRQVPPATALCIDMSLRETATRYWQPQTVVQPISLDEAAAVLEHHLDRAIRLRLHADVPVGCYVSGGLDSSVIGALAVERAGRNIETFGIRFADPRFDETAEQRLVVGHLGTRHHDIVCDADTIGAALDDVVWHCEAPMLRTSPVPLFLLSAAVRAAGMKAVLTGEGADELLAGYSVFKEDRIRRFWARDPDSRMRPALLSRVHHYVGADEARGTGLWQGFFAQDLAAVADPFYSHRPRWRTAAWTLRLLAPAVRASWDDAAAGAATEAALPADWRAGDPLLRAQLIEMQTFLSPWLLACQGDRVAMAHGVEVRYPFLDPELVDFCLTLPARTKLLGLKDKLALRRLAAKRLPAEIWQRRKQPYRAPITEALLADGLADAAVSAADGLVDAVAVRRLIDRLRRLDGHLPGEREEMGLVGTATLGLLAQAFGPRLADRLAQGRAALDRIPPTVLVDRGGSP
ncbi:MAG: asparagine synthase (glutamine-hydrolyzing) [Solirubrobacterales bacterium]